MRNIQKNTKAYWPQLKTFLNKKKIPVIPPLFHENKFVPDFKVALSGLRQFLASESPLKMIKNVFYFNSKALFVLKIFIFLS